MSLYHPHHLYHPYHPHPTPYSLSPSPSPSSSRSPSPIVLFHYLCISLHGHRRTFEYFGHLLSLRDTEEEEDDDDDEVRRNNNNKRNKNNILLFPSHGEGESEWDDEKSAFYSLDSEIFSLKFHLGQTKPNGIYYSYGDEEKDSVSLSSRVESLISSLRSRLSPSLFIAMWNILRQNQNNGRKRIKPNYGPPVLSSVTSPSHSHSFSLSLSHSHMFSPFLSHSLSTPLHSPPPSTQNKLFYHFDDFYRYEFSFPRGFQRNILHFTEREFTQKIKNSLVGMTSEIIKNIREKEEIPWQIHVVGVSAELVMEIISLVFRVFTAWNFCEFFLSDFPHSNVTLHHVSQCFVSTLNCLKEEFLVLSEEIISFSSLLAIGNPLAEKILYTEKIAKKLQKILFRAKGTTRSLSVEIINFTFHLATNQRDLGDFRANFHLFLFSDSITLLVKFIKNLLFKGEIWDPNGEFQSKSKGEIQWPKCILMTNIPLILHGVKILRSVGWESLGTFRMENETHRLADSLKYSDDISSFVHVDFIILSFIRHVGSFLSSDEISILRSLQHQKVQRENEILQKVFERENEIQMGENIRTEKEKRRKQNFLSIRNAFDNQVKNRIHKENLLINEEILSEQKDKMRIMEEIQQIQSEKHQIQREIRDISLRNQEISLQKLNELSSERTNEILKNEFLIWKIKREKLTQKRIFQILNTKNQWIKEIQKDNEEIPEENKGENPIEESRGQRGQEPEEKEEDTVGDNLIDPPSHSYRNGNPSEFAEEKQQFEGEEEEAEEEEDGHKSNENEMEKSTDKNSDESNNSSMETQMAMSTPMAMGNIPIPRVIPLVFENVGDINIFDSHPSLSSQSSDTNETNDTRSNNHHDTQTNSHAHSPTMDVDLYMDMSINVTVPLKDEKAESEHLVPPPPPPSLSLSPSVCLFHSLVRPFSLFYNSLNDRILRVILTRWEYFSHLICLSEFYFLSNDLVKEFLAKIYEFSRRKSPLILSQNESKIHFQIHSKQFLQREMEEIIKGKKKGKRGENTKGNNVEGENSHWISHLGCPSSFSLSHVSVTVDSSKILSALDFIESFDFLNFSYDFTSPSPSSVFPSVSPCYHLITPHHLFLYSECFTFLQRIERWNFEFHKLAKTIRSLWSVANRKKISANFIQNKMENQKTKQRQKWIKMEQKGQKGREHFAQDDSEIHRGKGRARRMSMESYVKSEFPFVDVAFPSDSLSFYIDSQSFVRDFPSIQKSFRFISFVQNVIQTVGNHLGNHIYEEIQKEMGQFKKNILQFQQGTKGHLGHSDVVSALRSLHSEFLHRVISHCFLGNNPILKRVKKEIQNIQNLSLTFAGRAKNTLQKMVMGIHGKSIGQGGEGQGDDLGKLFQQIKVSISQFVLLIQQISRQIHPGIHGQNNGFSPFDSWGKLAQNINFNEYFGKNDKTQ